MSGSDGQGRAITTRGRVRVIAPAGGQEQRSALDRRLAPQRSPQG